MAAAWRLSSVAEDLLEDPGAAGTADGDRGGVRRTGGRCGAGHQQYVAKEGGERRTHDSGPEIHEGEIPRG